ncbi:hypothetical protein TNIN_207091 [Trichonephila inaurata madagascariensis]|uniref:Uncharacterized protein n=1 Tax=Trichonephila inaurata madagascariensis TaxID=2747483 RepID=A0A8X7C6E2_9ARAC|nr:hypothetical protein TNIN_207091 [Trichonephila inaurata madagascariensis]
MKSRTGDRRSKTECLPFRSQRGPDKGGRRNRRDWLRCRQVTLEACVWLHLPTTYLRLPPFPPGNEAGEAPNPRGRIDLQVPNFEPFLEPLNTLLEMDEISDARAHFEETVCNVTVLQ